MTMRGMASRTVARMLWELRRGARACLRRFGMLGLLLPLCAVAVAVSLSVASTQFRLQASARNFAPVPSQVPNVGTPTRMEQGRTRLQAFDDLLLAHDDIPDAVQEILDLAERQGLVIARGEYKPVLDSAGSFLRYRMTLPIKGESGAINRFVQAALLAEPALVLESIQFRRDRPDAQQIEARLQWALLTRLPQGGMPSDLGTNSLAGGVK